MYKNVHLLPDEKITSNFIKLLEESCAGNNYYIVYGSSKSPRNFTITGDYVEYHDVNSKQFECRLSKLVNFEKVFMHSMLPVGKCRFLKHTKIIWVVWGADLYESLICCKGYNIYVDEEESYRVRATSSPIGKIPVWLYKLIYWFRYRINYNRYYSLLKNIYAVSSMDCDFQLIKAYFPELDIIFYPTAHYYPIEMMIGEDNMQKECIGNNIWVGNSPALNGNHISVFEKIKAFEENTKIYCPLSYGEERLKKYVESYGYMILGEKFFPLKKYLPTEEYYKLFYDANSFIFGHLRQCAVGNVLMALYFGGKCFLYKNNPLYGSLKNIGLIIFSIEDELIENFAKQKLSQEDRAHNRRIIMSLISKDAIREQMIKAFK